MQNRRTGDDQQDTDDMMEHDNTDWPTGRQCHHGDFGLSAWPETQEKFKQKDVTDLTCCKQCQ